MDVIELMRNRKSVRKFTDEPITAKERELILESALQAPTAGNMTLYSIIDVQDQTMKDKLADLCDHQPFIATAKLVLVFLADYQKWTTVFNAYGKVEMDESDLTLAMEDCTIAAQNAVIAAESLGIGSCYIGDIVENYEITKELFNLPQYAVPYCMLVFGKPEQSQITRKKPARFAIEDVVFVNQYENKTYEKTLEMFERKHQMNREELLDYLERFAKRKYFTDFRAEMGRSIKLMIQSWCDK